MHDLRELMRVVDQKYDKQAREILQINKTLEGQIQSVENAL